MLRLQIGRYITQKLESAGFFFFMSKPFLQMSKIAKSREINGYMYLLFCKALEGYYFAVPDRNV